MNLQEPSSRLRQTRLLQNSLKLKQTKITAILALLLAIALAACEREQRRFTEIAPLSGRRQPQVNTELRPGTLGAPGAQTKTSVPAPYGENAWAIAEGKRLYTWFNCVGCHAHGGGGMGPPLMDEKWIYGSDPESIHATILEGRPNGMPAYAGKLADQQVWQLVAYVRALGGLVRKDVRPGRNDDMAVRPSEQAMQSQTAESAGSPSPTPEQPR
jgi:cytochrome c oxidase cbb3-type subunit III